MTIGTMNDDHYYDLGLLPIPLFLLAGGAAAGAAITQALDAGWSTGEYNYWMRYMDSTIADWDKTGWDKGCWKKNPKDRERWLTFWNRFSTHYKRGLMTDDDIYLPDSYEKPAKELLKELQAWSARLNQLCGAGTSSIGQDQAGDGAPPPPSNPITDVLKWGTFAIAAVIGLNVWQTLRPPRR